MGTTGGGQEAESAIIQQSSSLHDTMQLCFDLGEKMGCCEFLFLGGIILIVSRNTRHNARRQFVHGWM